jgi:hypothetical protein
MYESTSLMNCYLDGTLHDHIVVRPTTLTMGFQQKTKDGDLFDIQNQIPQKCLLCKVSFVLRSLAIEKHCDMN